jgi:hypothetical protein
MQVRDDRFDTLTKEAGKDLIVQVRKIRINAALVGTPKNLFLPHGNHTILPGEFRLLPAPAFVF